MSKVSSRLLVIDASVARAAGETRHPVSSACRNNLCAILSICHRMVATRQIDAEWKRHASRYSRKWRRFMAGRGKIVPLTPKKLPVGIAAISGDDKVAIEKDLHLMEAANAADHIIITGDDSLREAILRAKKGAGLFAMFKWINPVRDGTDVLASL